jgi:hypothetical protein
VTDTKSLHRLLKELNEIAGGPAFPDPFGFQDGHIAELTVAIARILDTRLTALEKRLDELAPAQTVDIFANVRSNF